MGLEFRETTFCDWVVLPEERKNNSTPYGGGMPYKISGDPGSTSLSGISQTHLM